MTIQRVTYSIACHFGCGAEFDRLRPVKYLTLIESPDYQGWRSPLPAHVCSPSCPERPAGAVVYKEERHRF